MNNLAYIKKLYNGKNCYSDHMSSEELALLHVSSHVEDIIREMLERHRIVFLTGNPGDGKTFIIKAIRDTIQQTNAYVQTDINSVGSYDAVCEELLQCYQENRAAIIAVNEYPFMMLCKALRLQSQELYNEIIAVKKSAITYNLSGPLTGRVAVVDLNDRNLLDSNAALIDTLIQRFIKLLEAEPVTDATLSYNIAALKNAEIRSQIVSLFGLAAAECEHYAVRDILGALSFMLTSCTTEDHAGVPYYSALFCSANPLLQAVQHFDPIFLSSPALDEQLWNGEITAGWAIGAPQKWPCASEFDDAVDDAVDCFKSIKRKYYFENTQGRELGRLQPEEIQSSIDAFTLFDSQKKKIKERIIRSLNKLFLPSSDEKKLLRIWTTHRYDLSQTAAVALSSKAVESSALEIERPRPADWLKGMEYIPNHIILKPKGRMQPVLALDVDFLRTLNAVERGYPVGLLAPQYEQAASMFLQQLDDEGLAEDNDDGEILVASRKKSYITSVFVQDGKYGFEED